MAAEKLDGQRPAQSLAQAIRASVEVRKAAVAAAAKLYEGAAEDRKGHSTAAPS